MNNFNSVFIIYCYIKKIYNLYIYSTYKNTYIDICKMDSQINKTQVEQFIKLRQYKILLKNTLTIKYQVELNNF